MDTDKSESRRELVRKWFRREEFWQGVAASTISAGLLAAGTLLTALMTGLADWKTVLIGFLSFVVVFLAAWIGLNFVPMTNSARATFVLFKKTMKSEESGVSMSGAVAGLVAALFMLILTSQFLMPTA